MSAVHSYRDLSEYEIREALTYLDPNCTREEWVRYAMAIKSELGAAGFDLWDDWSKGGQSYSSKDARDTWKSIKQSGGVTIATLIHEAQQFGFSLNEALREPISQEEIEARRERRQREEAAAEAERHLRRAQAAARAVELWGAGADIEGNGHPYLRRKGVQSFGLRVGKWRNGEEALLVPMRNAEGQLVSLQAVFADDDAELGRGKDYLPGGQKRGSFHMIGGKPEGSAPIIAICEGYATGASIHQATGYIAAMAFDAGNVPVVAKALREQYPSATLLVCADNDQWNQNDGMLYAKQAAVAQRGILAVPAFADLSTEPTDFNDLHQLEGIETVRAQIAAVMPKAANDNEDLADDPEPFRVLGYDHDTFFLFQNEKMQLVRMTKGDLTENGFLTLAPSTWWAAYFPAKEGFDKRGATDWLIRECYKAGIYDPSRVRGRGAWMDEGRVVFHFGSHLWVDGRLMKVTAIRSRFVYEMDRELARPSEKALTDAEGQQLVDIAKRFRWTKPASAALLSGFVALAPLCGALRWRPHVWITGGAGCGKTTVLNEYVHRLMGGMDIFAQGNSTEAGIRQTLRTDALPVLFDESEQNNDREVGRVQNVLSLIRQASSESAAKTLKGSANGDAMHFIVRSMFCLSSIQVGMKHQADLERLTVLALRPKREDTDATATWAKLKEQLYRLERDDELPARLFRRSLELLPVTMQNIKTFVDAASRKFGSVREGDQYGTLLAGCWSLTSSELATPDEAAALIDGYDWEEFRESLEVDESTKALGALMEAQVRLPGGMSASVYEVIRTATGAAPVGIALGYAEAEALLQRYGMRVNATDLLLSNNSQALADLMRNTPYAADVRGQLLRVEGVRRFDRSVRFGGSVSKCIAVPLSAIMETTPTRDGAPY